MTQDLIKSFPAVFLVFVIVLFQTAGSGNAEELASDGEWNIVTTRHTIIRYSTLQDLEDFDAQIDYTPQSQYLDQLLVDIRPHVLGGGQIRPQQHRWLGDQLSGQGNCLKIIVQVMAQPAMHRVTAGAIAWAAVPPFTGATDVVARLTR